MKKINNIHKPLSSSAKFSKNVAYLLLANAINNGTIFLVNLLIARKYSPEQFGLFSVSVNIALFALTISEFGMNYTMIRFHAEHRNSPSEARKILLSNLYFKYFVIGALLITSILASSVIAQLVMNDKTHSTLVGIALLSGGILGLWSYFRSFFQIHGCFQTIAGLTIVYALLRIVMLSAVLLYTPLSKPEYMLLGVYVVPLIVVFCFGYYSLVKNMPSATVTTHEIWQTGIASINYSKWVALTGVSFMLTQQSMVFIVSSLGGIKQAAILNAGLVFTAVFSMINDAVRQVMFPDVAAYPLGKLAAYRQRILRLCPVVLLGAALIIGILSLLMFFALGQEYRASISIFWITGLGIAATSCIGFFTMTAHTIKKPQIDALVNCTSLSVFIVLCVFLIKYSTLQFVALAYAFVLVSGELAKMFLIGRNIPVAKSPGHDLKLEMERDSSQPITLPELYRIKKGQK